MPDDLPQCLTVWPGLQESGSAPARRASFFPPGELWLVPGELAKFQLREAFLRADVDGFRVVMAPRIHTFSSLENLLADELAPAEADELERRFLLSELAARLLPALGLKTKSGPEAGETGARPLPAVDSTLLCELADGLGDGFDRLRLAGISWDQLAAFPPSAFSTALAALGRRYDAALAALGRADRFAKRRRILEDLRAGRQFRALVGAEKIVCRWSQRFSPFESGLLAALMSQRQVEIKFNLPAWVRNEDLDHSSGFDLLRAVREVERGAADGPDALLEFSEGPPASEPALAYASEMLLAPPAYRLADPPPAGDRLNIVRAPTPYHEVEEAARRLKALAVQGHEPHHLALVVPDMEAYASLIDDVSRRFGLPFHLRRGEILGEKGPARAALDLLALWSSHWERPRVMRLLASPYFRLAEGDPAFWRRLALASGVTDDRAGGGFEDNLARAASAEARALLEAVRMLKTAGRRLEEARDWPTFIGRFKAFLNQAGWPGDLDLAPLSPVNMREADLSAAFAFKEELERLEAALNSPHAPAVGLASFRLWLTKITEERRLVYDANPEGRVWVLNYYDLHGGVFDEIFCLGLNERVFPRTGPESRWWPDEFISALSRTALGRALWSGPADRYRQEEFMLAAALGQARERVWLYYSAADMSGRPALPSPLIESLRDLWSERAPEERPFEESRAWPVPPPLEAARGPDELWANLAALRPEDWPAELRGDRRLVEGLESLRRRSGIWAGMRRVARPGPEAVRRWLDALARHNESPLLRAAFFSSFAECPLAFWWGEALELDCDGPSLEEWPGSEEGTVLHLTLEKFFRSRLGRPWPEASASAAAGASGAASRDKLAAELQALAEKECLRAEALSPLGRRPLWPLRRRRLFAILSGWLTRELAKETSSTPLELEWSFGAGAADAAGPLELPLTDGRSLFFKGRIDRIDESGAPGENRLLARDYKLRYRAAYEFDRQSGAPPPALYPAHLYALAASSALRRPAVSVMDFLNPMGGPAEHGGLGSGSPEMDLSLEVRAARKEAGLFSLPNRLEDIWRQARAGLFDPDSADGEPACDYCGFGLICPRADSGGEGEG